MNNQQIANTLRLLSKKIKTIEPHYKSVRPLSETVLSLADELDPQAKPLLADAKVGDLCRLRNGVWTQIEHIFTVCYPKRFRGLNGWSYSIDGKAGDPAYNVNDDYDIIYTEPLAPKGTAEWAWQMMLLSNMVIPIINPQTPWKLIGNRAETEISGASHTRENWIKVASDRVWQLYEAPSFDVGDWVDCKDLAGVHAQCKVLEIHEHNVILGCRSGIRWSLPHNNITRKLAPSEVRVKVTLEGTVSGDYDEKMDSFILNNADGHTRNRIKYSTIDPATCTLVKNLLKAQEEK